MAEGTDNVEDCISCDDSSYGEAMVLIVEARTRNMAVAIREVIGRCDSTSCSY